MQVGKLGFYAWKVRPPTLITAVDDDQVADNLLNQNISPVAVNEIWVSDITYLKTAEGWMYLAIVMNLFSRRIVGWHIDKRMTTDLISNVMINAVNLRQPSKGLVFHSDRARSTPVNALEICWMVRHSFINGRC